MSSVSIEYSEAADTMSMNWHVDKISFSLSLKWHLEVIFVSWVRKKSSFEQNWCRRKQNIAFLILSMIHHITTFFLSFEILSKKYFLPPIIASKEKSSKRSQTLGKKPNSYLFFFYWKQYVIWLTKFYFHRLKMIVKSLIHIIYFPFTESNTWYSWLNFIFID